MRFNHGLLPFVFYIFFVFAFALCLSFLVCSSCVLLCLFCSFEGGVPACRMLFEALAGSAQHPVSRGNQAWAAVHTARRQLWPMAFLGARASTLAPGCTLLRWARV